MAEFPTYEQMAKDVAEKALDEYLIDGKALREWIKIIAEQEYCGDCVSRQAVLDRIRESIETYSNQYTTDMLNMWGLFTQFIKEIPPVNLQEPKIGRWKSTIDGKPICSECGFVSESEDGYFVSHYCPNCGCRMVEPQENDHKCHTCKHYISGEKDGSCGSYICKEYSNWESEESEG